MLILRRPPPPGVSAHDLFRALGSIYGTKDAGRSCGGVNFRTLKKHNWKMSKIEAALFFLVVDGCLGILITHVDDLFCAGQGDAYHGDRNSSQDQAQRVSFLRKEREAAG